MVGDPGGEKLLYPISLPQHMLGPQAKFLDSSGKPGVCRKTSPLIISPQKQVREKARLKITVPSSAYLLILCGNVCKTPHAVIISSFKI